MIIVMKPGASQTALAGVMKKAERLGCRTHLSKGDERTIIGLIGDAGQVNPEFFQGLPGVEKVVRLTKPFKLASRDSHPEKTTVPIKDFILGGQEFFIMAGPCAVESRGQLLEIASFLKEAGIKILRGGIFKPRTSPYSFQGLKEKGLDILIEAKKKTGLAVVTEVMTPEQIPLVSRVADIIQVGMRSMQNTALLEAMGRSSVPVLLKRNMMATLEELLMAAEHILSKGNPNVILCERGIRTFEKYTRNTLDLNAVPVLARLSHLPLCVDPSHGTGLRDLVISMSKAAAAAGADCLLVEVHPRPEDALSDGLQSLDFAEFTHLIEELKPIAQAVGRFISE